jgi:hypothetical protein
LRAHTSDVEGQPVRPPPFPPTQKTKRKAHACATASHEYVNVVSPPDE